MKKILFSVVGVVLAVLIVSFDVSALTVAPTKVEIKGNPGETVTAEFELKNEQKGAITFYPSYENFEANGEEGTPNFVPGDNGLAAWMRTDKESITLEPGKYIKMPFTVTIPKDAEPGGYFAAIFWGTQPPASSGETAVSIGAKTGILVLLTVNGEVREGGNLLGFGTKDDARFFNSLPVTFAYRFQNGGGDRIKPLGDVVIKNMLWFTKTKFSANKNDGNVLPGSVRRFEATWEGKKVVESGEEALASDGAKVESNFVGRFFETVSYQWKNFAMGMYIANLDLAFGAEGKTVSDSFVFFVLPWQLMIVLIVILLVAFTVLRVFVRKYNKWIIAQATGGNRRLRK
ncbi:MAG: hypothetical protein WC651_00250 [Candidatus Gracilibacteria bacterium]|jgi:hypothetical protein